MRNWFTIKAAADANTPAEISIYDEIGGWGVTAKDFISDFKAKSGASNKVVLSINSPGGSVFDGWAIFNALKMSGKDITVRVMGIAASMASVIAMAGKRIEMPANSMMMVHNAISGVCGDAEDMREVADVLDKIDASIVATYMARTGKSEDEVRALMAADTYMTAAEAKDLGFVDEVIADVKASASFELDRLPENVRALFKGQAAEPAPKLEAPFAEQACALAVSAGVGEYGALWALKHTAIADVHAAIAHARDVRSLCAAANFPDRADTFIKAAQPLADVRATLINAMADASPAIDTAARKGAKPTEALNASPAPVTTSSIWAARNAK